MHPADFLRFTYGSLRSHRLRTLLTALGIAVGIASVILLTSIGEGLHRFVIAEFTQFGTNLISVTPGRTQTHGASLGAVNTVRPLSIDETLADGEEVFAAGTAWTLLSVRELVYREKTHEFPKTATREALLKRLRGIQCGTDEDRFDWTMEVPQG